MEPNSEKRLERLSYSDDEIKTNPRGILESVMNVEKKNGSFDYALRRRILALSNRDIETSEAFVKDSWILKPVGKTYDEIKNYLGDEQNWLEERVAFHNKVIEQAFIKCVGLSDRVNKRSGYRGPIVFLVRGNVGAGKTQALRTHPIFQPLLDDKQKPSGVVSPDEYKHEIREDMGMDGEEYLINHLQCHSESLVIERKLQTKLFSKPGLSMAFDERFAIMKRIKNLVSLAIVNRKKIIILDLDVPLEVSIVRNLKRDPNGKDPCISYDTIKQGFIDIRTKRDELLSLIRDDDSVNEHVTYYLLAESSSDPAINVAEKRGKVWDVLMDNLYKKLKSPETEVIEKLDRQKIDSGYIIHIRNLLKTQTFAPKERDRIIKFLEGHMGEELWKVVNNRAK